MSVRPGRVGPTLHQPKQPALASPVNRQARAPQQAAYAKCRRVPTLYDGGHDIGCQKAEPRQPIDMLTGVAINQAVRRASGEMVARRSPERHELEQHRVSCDLGGGAAGPDGKPQVRPAVHQLGGNFDVDRLLGVCGRERDADPVGANRNLDLEPQQDVPLLVLDPVPEHVRFPLGLGDGVLGSQCVHIRGGGGSFQPCGQLFDH